MAAPTLAADIKCIQASRSCKVFDLEQCIQVCNTVPQSSPTTCIENSTCSNDKMRCCKDVTLCLLHQDQVTATACIDVDLISPETLYFVATVLVDNNTGAVVTLDKVARVTVLGTEPLITEDAVVIGELEVGTEAPSVVRVVGAIPVTTDLPDELDFAIELTSGEVVVARAEFNLGDLQDVACKCSDHYGIIFGIIDDEETQIGTTDDNEENFLNGPVITGPGTIVFDARLEGDTGSANTICVQKSKAELTVTEAEINVEAQATLSRVSIDDWCVCKTGTLCPGAPPPCLRSPGFFASTGNIDGGDCAQCGNETSEEWPSNIEIEVGQQVLSQAQICAILNLVNPNGTINTEVALCLCENLTNPNNPDLLQILLVLRATIALRLNQLRGDVTLCPQLNTLLNTLLEAFATIRINLFNAGEVTIIQSICESAGGVPDPVIQQIINSILANIERDLDLELNINGLLDLLNDIFEGNSPFENCPIVICEDVEEQENCPCEDPTATYTITLTNENKQEAESAVVIRLTLGCVLSFDKIFQYEVHPQGAIDRENPLAQGTLQYTVGESTILTVNITNLDLEPYHQQGLTILITYTAEKFDLATCDPEPIDVEVDPIEVNIDITTDCIQLTTSELTDTTVPTCTTGTCSFELLTPDCGTDDSCEQEAINRTVIRFGDGDDQIELRLCEDGEPTEYRDQLVAFLEKLVNQNGQQGTIDIQADLLALLEAYETETGNQVPDDECGGLPFDIIEITYVLRFPNTLCSVENTVTAETEQTGKRTTISRSSVILQNPFVDCENIAEQVPMKEKLVTSSSLPKNLSKSSSLNTLPTVMKKQPIVKSYSKSSIKQNKPLEKPTSNQEDPSILVKPNKKSTHVTKRPHSIKLRRVNKIKARYASFETVKNKKK